MEERAYVEALDTSRALASHDRTLVPVVWQGRALKCLGRLSEAIDVLQGGLKGGGAADESFRHAVVLRNLACYRALASKDVESVIMGLEEALQLAPEFREGLRTENLDGDLAPLLGNPIFDRGRADVLSRRR